MSLTLRRAWSSLRQLIRMSIYTIMRRFVAGLIVVNLGMAAGPVLAAQIAPDLSFKLSQATPTENVSVLVFLKEQFDVTAPAAQSRFKKASLQATHKLLIEELRNFAGDHQSAIVRQVEAGAKSGSVRSFETYWIANSIKVEATPAFIRELSQREDVAFIIPEMPMQSLYNPNQVLTDVSANAGASPGLSTIGAREMWAMGYTGQGRLVASFDTGVDGTHPALSGSWRGLTHSAAESWFDPLKGSPTPVWDPTMSDPGKHGTHTMGVMVGRDDASGDTTGVAFGAQWISARVVDIPGANYLQAFQWVADPDGNPNTIEDVPDVLNNSWGFRQDDLNCSDVFWNVIDNVEALGTVVIFACGNEGPNDATIRNPANRATTLINTFSVGATDTLGEFVWSTSSRGPSDCDGVSIKPEVVAPGYLVRTTTPNTGGSFYTIVTGTSFAAPHVAGAVALLRQYNPNATVDEIKWALYNSAIDLGAAGEDNNSGMGIINIPAAMALLPPNDQVNVFVKAVEHVAIDPGSTVAVRVTLQNSGVDVTGVTGTLVNPEAGITIEEGASTFGSLPQDGNADNNDDPYVLQFDNHIADGTQLTVDLQINGSGGYAKVIKLYFTVGTALVKSIYTHTTDSLKFTVSNFAAYGLAPGSVSNGGGQGFRFPTTGENNLYQCGLMIGNDAISVSDAITNDINSIDEDYRVAPGGNLTTIEGGVLGDHESFSRYRDALAHRPLGITVEQRTASFDGATDASYLVMEFVIFNDNDTALSDVYVGMYFDWDFPEGSGSDRANYDESIGLGYMWYNNQLVYRGTTVLNPEGVSSFNIVANAQVVYDGLTEAEKFELLTVHDIDTMSIFPDRSYAIATGPFSLAPGASDTAAFAIVAARNLPTLQTTAQRAQAMYRQATPVDDDPLVLPREFALSQNFPNPFNPITQIEFNLRRAESVRLEVFNALGQTVATLIEGDRPAGTHVIQWFGVDDRGNEVASGVYFYRLTAGERSEVRKMMLLK